MDQSGPAPMPAPSSPAPRRARWWRWPVGLGVAAVAWTGLVGAWLPGFLKPRIEQATGAALGTPVTLGEVALQPWTLTATVNDARIGPADAPFLRLQQAQVQVSAESLWRLAPVVRRVTLRGPSVLVERQSADRFNFSAVLDHLRAQPASPDASEPVRFAVHNIRLEGGEVRYVDRVLNQTHRIDQIQLGVPFVSNLPSLVEVDVAPLLSARIDGSPIKVEGRSRPFTAARTSEVRVAWQGVRLRPWAEAVKPLLPPGWQVHVPSGEFATALTVRFEARTAPALPSVVILGEAHLRGLTTQASGLPGIGPVEAGWRELAVTGIEARPLERQVRVGRVDLDGLDLAMHPAVPSTRSAHPAPAESTAAAPAEATPWRWQLDELRVAASRLALQTEPAAAWPALQAVQFNARGLQSGSASSPGPAPAVWRLAARDEHGAVIEGEGRLDLARQQAEARVKLGDVGVSAWTAPLAALPAWRALPLQPTAGRLGVQVALTARWAPDESGAALTVQDGLLTLQDVQARPPRAVRGVDDRVDWRELKVSGVQARLAGGALQNASVAEVRLAGLDARVRRDAQGRVLGWGNAPSSSSAPRPARAAAPSSPAPAWQVARVACEDCALRFLDEAVAPAARLELSRLALRLDGLSQDLGKPLTVALSTRAQGGELRVDGQVRPQPLSVQTQLGVRNVQIAALRPYLDPWLNVSLARAQAQASGRLQLQDDPRQGLTVRYQGRAGVTALRVIDRLNEADFLTWKALSLDGMDVRWSDRAPLQADFGRIQLQDFYGRVIINPDGRLNLAHIVRQPDDSGPRSVTTPESSAAGAPAPAPSAAASSPAAPAPRLRWQQIQLAGGRVDFTDNFIQPNYSARLTQVAGTVSAVSSEGSEPADVSIAGAVDDGAPLRITGRLHPLGPRLYTDIEGSAKGIELTRLSPYAARYAGYAIEKGTLSVSVHYRVDGGQLQADNQVFLDQLTFGERTDSPDATSLPVRLAVSLLKNRRGEIDVNLPISGSLDEPQFSVGGIIWRVVVNLITKAVTAPFALLSGGGSEELGFVAFAPGSSTLDEASQKRLTTLAEKLNDRPALKLEATGHADPQADADGLRDAHVERLMREAKAKATRQPLAEVTVEPAERLTWLTAAYKAADIKKPRNLVGLAKSLPADEMTALLKAAAPVDERALRALADRRGDAVKAFLVQQMAPERVLLTASQLAPPAGGEDRSAPSGPTPTARVQFSVR